MYDAKQQKDVAAPATLYFPVQRGSQMPTVIVMTGCDGSVSNGAIDTMRDLLSNGILVVQLRSLEPWSRGSACNRSPKQMLGVHRSTEAYILRAMLVERKLAVEDNVGLLGFSHGGWAITHAIYGDTTAEFQMKKQKPFAAAVAYYPHCQTLDVGRYNLLTPTLLMGGTADTWTPFAVCRRMEELTIEQSVDKAVPLALVEFDGATHSWDNQKPMRYFDTDRGPSILAYDPNAARQSRELTAKWFAKYLRH